MHGRTLCEDCYMDGLSPAKACDPWAAYCAKSTVQSGVTGGIKPAALMERLKHGRWGMGDPIIRTIP